MISILKIDILPGWKAIKISGRADSFKFAGLMQELKLEIENEKNVAIDLSSCDFMSLPFLKFLLESKDEMSKKGGRFVLINLNHQIRRQIEIFLGTKNFEIFQSFKDLRNGYYRYPKAEFNQQQPQNRASNSKLIEIL